MPPLPDGAARLLWRVTWTLAFPTAVPFLLQRRRGSSSDDDGCDNNDDDIDDDDDDGYVWYHLAFLSLWRDETTAIIGATTTNAARRSTWGKSASPSSLLLSSSSDPRDSGSGDAKDNNKGRHPWSDSLGYGEITEQAVFEILRVILGRQQQHHPAVSAAASSTITTTIPDAPSAAAINVVVDLGSGTGRVVLAAALALLQVKTTQQRVGATTYNNSTACGRCCCMGLEIVPKLHQQAVKLQQRWNDGEQLLLSLPLIDNNVNNNESDWSANNATVLDFRCCDFTDDAERSIIAAADLIFMHGTVFEEALFVKTCQLLCAHSKPGAWIVTVSRPLLLITAAADDRWFEYVAELHVEMSWGRGTVYLQRRKRRL